MDCKTTITCAICCEDFILDNDPDTSFNNYNQFSLKTYNVCNKCLYTSLVNGSVQPIKDKDIDFASLAMSLSKQELIDVCKKVFLDHRSKQIDSINAKLGLNIRIKPIKFTKDLVYSFVRDVIDRDYSKYENHHYVHIFGSTFVNWIDDLQSTFIEKQVVPLIREIDCNVDVEQFDEQSSLTKWIIDFIRFKQKCKAMAGLYGRIFFANRMYKKLTNTFKLNGYTPEYHTIHNTTRYKYVISLDTTNVEDLYYAIINLFNIRKLDFKTLDKLMDLQPLQANVGRCICGHGKIIATTLECDYCHKKACIKCLNYEHDGDCKQEDLELAKYYMENCQRCPESGHWITKKSGCDDMYCTYCGAMFSFNTGERISNTKHNPEKENTPLYTLREDLVYGDFDDLYERLCSYDKAEYGQIHQLMNEIQQFRNPDDEDYTNIFGYMKLWQSDIDTNGYLTSKGYNPNFFVLGQEESEAERLMKTIYFTESIIRKEEIEQIALAYCYRCVWNTKRTTMAILEESFKRLTQLLTTLESNMPIQTAHDITQIYRYMMVDEIDDDGSGDFDDSENDVDSVEEVILQVTRDDFTDVEWNNNIDKLEDCYQIMEETSVNLFKFIEQTYGLTLNVE